MARIPKTREQRIYAAVRRLIIEESRRLIMKTTEDGNGVIHYHYNIFDRIYIWIMNRTVWRFKSWFFHTRFGDWFWREILWGKFGIKPYHRPNDFEEATFYLYVQIERETEKNG
jgi:hypothetical protein